MAWFNSMTERKAPLGQGGEQALGVVDPGRAGGREVDMEARMASQPSGFVALGEAGVPGQPAGSFVMRSGETLWRGLGATAIRAARYLAPFSMIISFPVVAFEVNGIRAGMSVADVQRRAGPLVQAGEVDSQGISSYFTDRRDGYNSAFTFCRGALFQLNYNIPGGFPAFVRLVSQENTRLGLGSANTSTGDTQYGAYNALVVKWQERTWLVQITASQRDNLGIVVHRTWFASADACGQSLGLPQRGRR